MDSTRLLALQLAEGRNPTAGDIEAVAAATSPEAAAWAFTQRRLRSRGRAKFSRADDMLFDQDGLEMASHEVLARFHAARFPMGARVADLTVGIGGDLIALARKHEAVGFEVDPDRAEVARHNVAAHGCAAEVRCEDCLAAKWDFDYAFADPARRSYGRRTLDPTQFQPDLRRLVERMRALSLGLIKLSPMLDDAFLESLRGKLEFVSLGGECREALAGVADAGELRSSVWAVRGETGEALRGGGTPGHRVVSPLEYLFEADPAAIRAHALGTLCDEHSLCALGDSNGYLTGSDLVVSAWLKAYRVLGVCSADDKATRAKLRELGASVSAVKARAQKVDVEAIARKFKGLGDRPVLLVVYPAGQSRRRAIVEAV